MRSRSSIPISPCLLSVYLCLYVYILMSKPQSISLCRVYRCVDTCRRGIHAVYHFCMKLACGRTASQHALAHSPWLSTPQTSTRTCTQVIFHSHCSTGALGAQLRHPCRATWHESAVKAYPGTPLGASWRAPARSPSTQNTRHTCRHTWPCRAARARAFRRVWHVRFRIAKPLKTGRFHRQTRFRITLRVLLIFQKFQAQQVARVLRMSIELSNVHQQWRNHFV
jgi:hypothetical protein